MSFWKSLFIPTTTDSEAALATDTETAETDNAPRIVLSNNREVDLYELEELCDSVGWARRPIRKVKKAIEHSFLVVTMWRENGAYKRLIGFARATSDCTFNATVWDVVLHPDFQNKGLGKALMQRVIDDLRAQDISNITLFADPDVVGFYEGLGFTPDPDGIKGMFWYPENERR
ncbi:MAG: GNAT family N-acetyltransferase [Cyanobacteria bacterium P01_E01_bin.34]